jgi:hypothetical protein
MTKFEELKNASESVRLRILLWKCIDEWEEKMSIWNEGNFHNLDVEEMNTFIALNSKYVMQFKLGLPNSELIDKIDNAVKSFKQKMLIISILRNPDLKFNHWNTIENILQTKFPTQQPLTLSILEDEDAFNYGTELTEVSGQASSEAALLAMLKKIEDSWKLIDLIVIPYKNMPGVFILGSLEQVQLTLEEANININTLITAKHVKIIKNRVEEWKASMDLMDDILVSNLSYVYVYDFYNFIGYKNANYFI